MALIRCSKGGHVNIAPKTLSLSGSTISGLTAGNAYLLTLVTGAPQPSFTGGTLLVYGTNSAIFLANASTVTVSLADNQFYAGSLEFSGDISSLTFNT